MSHLHTRGVAQASKPRQLAAAKGRAIALGDKIVKVVSEVVSGTLPLARRGEIMKLLSNGRVEKIYVESCRALSRSAKVAEELFDHSVQKGVQTVPADLPDLFQHDQTPVQRYVRRVICATTELERDLTVQRLRDGIVRKMATTRARTQSGRPKVSGAKTLLDRLNPNRKVLQKLQVLCVQYKRSGGTFGLRSLARQLSHELRLPQVMGHETARRICQCISSSRQALAH
jgi:DNA invertase Pin-like site-specific DNA recombinase